MQYLKAHVRRIALSAALALGLVSLSPALALAAAVPGHFLYTFNVAGVVNEAGSMSESPSPYWWVNSGGKMLIGNDTGKTVQGSLNANDYWRKLYAANNPLDTDNGYHPQNIFRLVSKKTWGNAVYELAFKINALNNSTSPNRDGHNGVLFFARYVDGSNLYYAGVRSDGAAVIKKKIGGAYYTLAQTQVFGTKGAYNRTSNPSLLPQNTWIRMKLDAKNNTNGSVTLALLLDKENDGSFVKVAEAIDSGTGGKPLLSGHAGIRTDFMDVEFDNFRVRE